MTTSISTKSSSFVQKNAPQKTRQNPCARLSNTFFNAAKVVIPVWLFTTKGAVLADAQSVCVTANEGRIPLPDPANMFEFKADAHATAKQIMNNRESNLNHKEFSRLISEFKMVEKYGTPEQAQESVCAQNSLQKLKSFKDKPVKIWSIWNLFRFWNLLNTKNQLSSKMAQLALMLDTAKKCGKMVELGKEHHEKNKG